MMTKMLLFLIFLIFIFQHQGSNGLSPRYANNISTASRDLPKEHSNDESIINGKDEDIQFRRQSFDRNSVLRQSKKRSRKNSTASAGNGSVLVTSPTSRSNGGSVPKTAEKEPSSQVLVRSLTILLQRTYISDFYFCRSMRPV